MINYVRDAALTYFYFHGSAYRLHYRYVPLRHLYHPSRTSIRLRKGRIDCAKDESQRSCNYRNERCAKEISLHQKLMTLAPAISSHLTMFARHVENILINTTDRLRERASSKGIT